MSEDRIGWSAPGMMERGCGLCFFEMVCGPAELGKVQEALKRAS